MSRSIPVTFRIYQGSALCREERHVLGVIKLGSLPSAQLRIEDPAVSRVHAVLEAQPDGSLRLVDLASTHGTQVNGRRVREAVLANGDAIEVGSHRLELLIDAPAATLGRSPAAPETRRAAEAPAAAPVPAMTGPAMTAPAAMPAPATAPATAPAAVTAPAAMTAPAGTGSTTAAAGMSTTAAMNAPAATSARGATTASAATTAPAAPSGAAATSHVGAGLTQAAASAPTAVPSPAPVGSSPPALAALAPASEVPPAGAPAALAASAKPDASAPAGAVEVAAMLGDTVLAVKHCAAPGAGARRARAHALLGLGAAGLLLAAGAFATAVHAAGTNQAARARWVALGRPARAFRPRELSWALDAAALAGTAGGLALVTAGLARARRGRRRPGFHIGTAPGVELATEAPLPSFPLVAPRGEAFVANVAPGMEGALVVDGVATPLAALAGQGRAHPSARVPGALEVPLPARGRLEVRHGLTSFRIAAVAPPRPHPGLGRAARAPAYLAYAAGSAAVHVGLVLLLDQVPIDDGSAGLEVASAEDLSTRASGATAEEAPPPPPEASEAAGDGGGEGAAAMALPEGRAGTPSATAAEARLRVARRQDDPALARAEAIEAARSAGILGSSALRAEGLAALVGTADLASGLDDATAWGGAFGASGEQLGSFGFGQSFTGPGGGCEGGCGTVSTGRFRTIGHGRDVGEGPGGHGPGGDGPRGLRRHAGVDPCGPRRPGTDAAPCAEIGRPTASDYDPAVIRRYVRRSAAQISYCYERQLLANPALSGTVTVRFFIAPSGAVTSSTGEGVDPSVAGCVAQVIGAISFPPAPGGGGAQVSYPFHFRNTGGGR